jgi:hypothetical protein
MIWFLSTKLPYTLLETLVTRLTVVVKPERVV